MARSRTARCRAKTPDRTQITSEITYQDQAEQLRAHLYNQQAEDLPDDLANRLMSGAYQHLEKYLHRPLIAHRRVFLWQKFPCFGARINNTPVRSILRVFYADTDFAEHDIDSQSFTALGLGDFANIKQPVLVYPKGEGNSNYNRWDVEQGTDFENQPYPFRIQADVGWEISDIPPPLQQAALMMASDWFTQKVSGVGAPMYRVKHDVRAIVSQYSHNYARVI